MGIKYILSELEQENRDLRQKIKILTEKRNFNSVKEGKLPAQGIPCFCILENKDVAIATYERNDPFREPGWVQAEGANETEVVTVVSWRRIPVSHWIAVAVADLF